MRSYTVEGIILKKSKSGEADHILTLFTANHGKVTVVAKGVRRPTSKRAASLQLFNRLKASIVPGHTSLPTLAEVQIIDAFPSWRSQLGRITLAFEICEIVDKLTPDHQPHPEVFALLSGFLSRISSLGDNWQEKIDQLKIDLLSELGFWSDAKKPQGNLDAYIESLISRPLHSPKLLRMLKSTYGHVG